MTVAVAVLALLLAAANGGNDVAKGIATLAGSGVTSYRTAIVWGAGTTFAGAVASAWVATGLTSLFADGIVETSATPAFALAVLLGTAGWLVVATGWRLPVSTTHALVGALIGAGLALRPGSVQWQALTGRVVRPLLGSAAVAFIMTALIVAAVRAVRSSRQRRERSDARRATAALPPLVALHWLSSGAVGAARGLNDTPKLAAVAGIGLGPTGLSPMAVALTLAVAMLIGALTGGIRVARRLGDDVIAIRPGEGLGANTVTALLVGFGARHGLPMSTTHVSTGAIAGLSGGQVHQLNLRTLQAFALAWTATPVAAALVAAGAATALR